ncbi:putative enzyme [Candidatus Promineifilum breve]|uniref:Enzyme n=1 Tax=Candidatus Promineifilum breve TaxID=1806508 RepID=A0A160T8A3_9CHLR|nr:amidohydrolase [Candidatus Promineifilum breve]CUS05150.2 putative enzyme [Candidatus Promineifilum breve]
MLEKATALQGEMSRLRRIIHANPELSFREYQTAALVADTLAEIGGYTIRTQVGKTGVVADLGDSGPLLAIRADMDALPILEANDAPYCSCNPGVMHACGHDAHTAILLGVAHLLRQSYADDKWAGRVRLLFQPSEEDVDENYISGATAMMNDGALAGVDAVIALHVSSDKPSGRFMFQDGPSLAAVDSFDAWIRGDGAHGAYPHTGSDPIFMLAPILTALYAIPSRRINPLYPSVVSVGQVSGGATTNVIPNEVLLRGTLRSLLPDVREQLWADVENALRLSEVMGGSYELEIVKGYPPMINDAEANGWMRQAAADLLGQDVVVNTQFGMGAEDFAYMTQQAKGAMFMLGAALPEGPARHHHTSIFDIDEAVLTSGAAVLAETARRFVTGRL